MSEIARRIGTERKTVRRLRARQEPPRSHYAKPHIAPLESPSLQPYVTYLQERWLSGCSNAIQLTSEIREKGYSGSRSLVAQALRPWREPKRDRKQRRVERRLSLRWLCLKPPAQLSTGEREVLERLLDADEMLARGHEMLQSFRKVAREHDLVGLDRWIEQALSSGVVSFVGSANCLLADMEAVRAALVLPWSNGMLEGHVNRVKLIERMGYGRASFDLLRRRVLAA